MPNFDGIDAGIQNGFETIVSDSQLGPIEKWDDGTFPNAGVSDHDDSLVGIRVFFDLRHSVSDHLLQLGEIQWLVHLNLKKL